MHHPKTTTALLALLVAGMATDTSAAVAQREKVSNATGTCQAALPTFEGLIRKRPLAVQNEGLENAFVTCSMTTDTGFGGSDGTESVTVYFINNGAAVQTVNCTAVFGRALVGTPLFIAKSVDLNPGTTAAITWNAADNDGDNFPSTAPVNVSCNIPPGTGVSNSYVSYEVDIGD